MKKTILTIVAVLSMTTLAHALSVTYYLDEVNTNNTGTNGPWATVTLSDTKVDLATTSINDNLDAIHIVVDPIDSAFINIGSNFSLQSFYFNENTSFGNSLIVGNFSPTGWNVNYSPGPNQQSNNAGGGFGKFEFLAAGNGSSRANPLSFDIYTLANQELTIANFSTVLSTENYLFAAHIADYNGGESAKFATDGAPVPEPGTIVLLGAGLLGLGLYGRKRAKK